MQIEISFPKFADYNPRADYKSMPWIRLQARTYRERKLYGSCPSVKWCWIAMLCVVAEEGKNGKLTCDIAWLAKEIDFGVEKLTAALRDLSARQMISLVESELPYVTCTADVRTPNAERSLRTDETYETRRNETNVPAVTPSATADAKPRARSAFRFDAADLKAAAWFQAEIKRGNPGAKMIDKANLEQWAHDLRLMRKSLNLTYDDLAAVMSFALLDGFWGAVMQSPANLKKNWDKITAAMNRPRKLVNAGGFRGVES